MSLSLANLHLDPFACAEDFTLQVETSPLLGIVLVEEFLEALHGLFEVGLGALRGFDVEDLAGLVESEAGGGKGIASFAVVLGGIFGRGGGLFVGFGKGPPEDAGAGDDDLRDDAMGLGD